MAYDVELADRIRARLAGEAHITEQQMFGGLAFLVNGNMAVAASGRGGLMVRVDPADSERLVANGAAEPMIMRGRAMTGWLRVSDDRLRTTRQLSAWVDRGLAHARSLPPKPRRTRRA